ncbi:hypothetical protein GCM10028803_57720 [Larkinella knui]|uniref:Uncharacterized protein n=1 Tax=Larkinella knui TaxID=2025310 RepID=A0A3P1CHP3_9BACT|nr:hypothetical protein [Larkinella knui]RRB12789.1 hypothetical protein EHT87_21675 [Larkinella knui]
MTKRNTTVGLVLIQLVLLAFSCKKTPATPEPTPANRQVNLGHLDHLYQTFKLPNGAEVGTIAIYSNAPNYDLIGDDDEGFTCIDDVARAALFVLREPDLATNTGKQDKLRKMTEFVLQLQSDNGYFYNFLWPDRTINKTYQTSVNQPNWWSWRALWYLSEAYPYFQKADATVAARIQTANQKLVTNMIRDFGNKPMEMNFIQGLKVPKWLPYGSGTDQAAIMMLGLLNYHQQTPDAQALKLIELLGEGIVLMQQGDATHFPYGAILSFENAWHAYGSDQAYALLRVGKALNKTAWIDVAKREIDYFYPYLLKQGFLESFEVKQQGTEITATKTSRFAQIAYGVRPLVWATLEAYDQTKEARYADLAAQLTGWFLGANPANVKMYDATTGRCFDGISSATNVNRNSGAESTIEALWAFQKIETYPAALQLLEKYK